jgi:hypothetical protein
MRRCLSRLVAAIPPGCLAGLAVAQTTYNAANGGIDEVVSATIATGSPRRPAYDSIIFRSC